MDITIARGDLLIQPVDAIVNTWNCNIVPPWMLRPRGVAKAIKDMAGPEPFEQLAKMGPIPLGEARVTTAGRLPHRAIIHVAGINIFWRATEASIRTSVRSAIRVASEYHFDSIAMPVIGAGSGGMAPSRAQNMILDELRWIPGSVKVTLVLYQKPTRGN